MKLSFDPRTKLYLLILANLTLFLHISLMAEMILAVLLLSLYFLSGKKKHGIRMAILYGVLVGMDILVIPVAEGFLLNLVSLLSVGFRMMLPCIISGAYVFSTTTVGEMVCAMRRLKIPDLIIIPCVTVLRFFPTIGEDYRQIRNAMSFRGIASDRVSLFRHPVRSLEYILIPLLINSSSVANDLSVAALTKGIRMPGKHTSMTELRMEWYDWICMAACTMPFLLFPGGIIL